MPVRIIFASCVPLLHFYVLTTLSLDVKLGYKTRCFRTGHFCIFDGSGVFRWFVRTQPEGLYLQTFGPVLFRRFIGQNPAIWEAALLSPTLTPPPLSPSWRTVSHPVTGTASLRLSRKRTKPSQTIMSWCRNTQTSPLVQTAECPLQCNLRQRWPSCVFSLSLSLSS